MVFNEYADYYDEIYKEKRYGNECVMVDDTINKYMNPDKEKNLIDLGCGTGTHAHIFKEMGYNVAGIDASEKMIEKAKNKFPDIAFEVADISHFYLDTPVDVATSMFHVVSYLDNICKVKAFLSCVNKSLIKGGLLIFDVWCGNGVLTEQPEVRKKEIKKGIYRTAVPTVNLNNQTVKIDYTITDVNKKIEERHTLRYYFGNELRLLLESKGFEVLEMSNLSHRTWSIFVVARKK